MRFTSGPLMACIAFVSAGSAQAQDRPPIGFPMDPKERAYVCSGQVMLAAYEVKESSSAWPHSEAVLMETGRHWVEDYARRSGPPVEAVMSGDIAKLGDTLMTSPAALRASTLNWCVKSAPQ